MKYQIFDTDLAAVIRWGETGAILVVGDLMLDEYIWGTVTRISPEVSVPDRRPVGRYYAGAPRANAGIRATHLRKLQQTATDNPC